MEKGVGIRFGPFVFQNDKFRTKKMKIFFYKRKPKKEKNSLMNSEIDSHTFLFRIEFKEFTRKRQKKKKLI